MLCSPCTPNFMRKHKIVLVQLFAGSFTTAIKQNHEKTANEDSVSIHSLHVLTTLQGTVKNLHSSDCYVMQNEFCIVNKQFAQNFPENYIAYRSYENCPMVQCLQ